MKKKDNDNQVIDRSQYFIKLREAVDARNKFLDEHPELEEFQEEIYKEMKKAGSWENKAAVLKNMMEGKIDEMKKELLKLQKIANNTERET